MSDAARPLLQSTLVARSPVYYGWFVLVAATVGMMMTIPGQTSGLAVFLDAMIADLGMSRSHVATLYLVGTLLGSLGLPWVGRFIDRRGPRLAVVVIAALFAGACVWMGFVRETVTLLIGFTLIRALGQGALSLVSVHGAAIWFVRRRGVAVAIIGIGWAIWTAAYPSLVERFLAPYGWRTSYMLLGAMVALTILPLGGLLFRERPERFGLVADGATAPAASAPAPLPAEPGYTAREARGTPTFWLFLTGLFLSSAVGPLLFSIGLDAAGSYAPIVTAAAVPAVALGLATPFLRLRVAGRVR